MENIINNLPIEYYNHAQLIILTKSGQDFVFISNYMVLESSWVKPKGSLYSIIDKNLEVVKQNISMQEIYEENYQILANNQSNIKGLIGTNFGCQALARETLRFSRNYLTELGIEKSQYFLSIEQVNATVMLLKKNDNIYIFFKDSGCTDSALDNNGDIYQIKTKDGVNIKCHSQCGNVLAGEFEELIVGNAGYAGNDEILQELKKLRILSKFKKYFNNKIKELEKEDKMYGNIFNNNPNNNMRKFIKYL